MKKILWIKLTLKLSYNRHSFLPILNAVQHWFLLSLKCCSEVTSLKGLSHETDFENFDKKSQNLA
jgi:hypothetical protein